MADVSRDRGQLLLFAAVGLAVLFVTLALVMNTVIYTENLATRSSKVAGGSEAIGYRGAVEEGLGGLLTHANHHNNTTHADLESNLTHGVDEWDNATGKLYAQSGRGTNVSIRSVEDGTRIEQDDSARNFTNSSLDATDWTLVTNVDHTREFRINVTEDTSNLGGFGSGNEFEVLVDDGSNTWRLNVTDDGGDVVVGIANASGGHATCTASSAEPWINVTAGTVAGDDCEGLRFAEGLTAPYSVEFGNGDNVTGTYTLVVDNASLASNPGPNFNDDDGSGSPYVTPAIYATKVDVTVQSPRLHFNTTVRIAPGEADG